MTSIRTFLQGKKTYICAAALAVATVLGWWFGYISGPQATAMLATAGALAGLGAKSQRAAETMMAALTEVHRAQNNARLAHKPLDAKQLASDVAATVVPQVIAAVTHNAIPIAGTAVVGAVPSSTVPTPGSCVYCDTPWYGLTNFECTSPDNKTTPDATGKRYHVFPWSSTGSASK